MMKCKRSGKEMKDKELKFSKVIKILEVEEKRDKDW